MKIASQYSFQLRNSPKYIRFSAPCVSSLVRHTICVMIKHTVHVSHSVILTVFHFFFTRKMYGFNKEFNRSHHGALKMQFRYVTLFWFHWNVYKPSICCRSAVERCASTLMIDNLHCVYTIYLLCRRFGKLPCWRADTLYSLLHRRTNALVPCIHANARVLFIPILSICIAIAPKHFRIQNFVAMSVPREFVCIFNFVSFFFFFVSSKSLGRIDNRVAAVAYKPAHTQTHFVCWRNKGYCRLPRGCNIVDVVRQHDLRFVSLLFQFTTLAHIRRISVWLRRLLFDRSG